MAPANFWTEKKKRHGAALSLQGTRGTVQVFERQGVQVYDLIRSGSKFVTGIPFGFYADSRVNTWTAQVFALFAR